MRSGAKIFISQDVPSVTANRRKEFLSLHPELRTMEAHYGLLHPCTLKNKTTSYDDSAKLRHCIHAHTTDSIDTAGPSSR